MEMSKNQQFLIVALIIFALAASSALLLDPKLGRSLVVRPFHIQPIRTGLASVAPNNTVVHSNWTQAGSEANLKLTMQ